MSSTNSDPHDLQRQLRHMLYGYTTTQLLYVAAKTGLADHLSEGPQGLESLAGAMAVEAAVLPRLLRALVALGLIGEESAAHYSLTPLGALLKSDGPGALRDQAIMTGAVLFPAWGGLLQTLQSGDTAFELIFDQPFFDFLQASPEIKAHFFKFLAAGARSATTELLTAYDFNPAWLVAKRGHHAPSPRPG
jgi:hypothetical protein